MTKISILRTSKFTAASMVLIAASFTGCDSKEKMLDIETPNGSLEVERSAETGNVDIEIDDN